MSPGLILVCWYSRMDKTSESVIARPELGSQTSPRALIHDRKSIKTPRPTMLPHLTHADEMLSVNNKDASDFLTLNA